MKNIGLLLFLSVLIFSCSHQGTKNALALRSPSSQAPLGSCLENVSPLVESASVAKTYRLSEFSHLFTERRVVEPEMIKVVELNSAPELKEQSLVIFELLRRLHPEETAIELVARYKNHFAFCP